MSKQETFKIGEIEYVSDSLTERGQDIVSDISRVDELIAQINLQMSVANLGRAKLVDALEEEAQHFTVVPAND